MGVNGTAAKTLLHFVTNTALGQIHHVTNNFFGSLVSKPSLVSHCLFAMPGRAKSTTKKGQVAQQTLDDLMLHAVGLYKAEQGKGAKEATMGL